MRAIQYYGPQNIKLENVMVKPPQAGEIVVKVESALTCGTDVKTFRRGHPVLIKNIPSGFGHEFAGIVDRVGAGVKNVKVGDRVVAANSAPCGKCFYCRREEYNLCENLDLLNGAYAEYITVPARIVEKNTIIIPNSLSFDKAAFNLGCRTQNFEAANSSVQKGESLYDTVKFFESIGCDAVVIRHPKENYYNDLVGRISIPVVSGGDGTGNHPSQSLLDLMTIREEFGHFEGLKIVIVGDIVHSRVAHSNYEIMKRLGMEVYTSGPKQFEEPGYNYVDFDKILPEVDIVMLLRVQHERHHEAPDADLACPDVPDLHHRLLRHECPDTGNGWEMGMALPPCPVRDRRYHRYDRDFGQEEQIDQEGAQGEEERQGAHAFRDQVPPQEEADTGRRGLIISVS